MEQLLNGNDYSFIKYLEGNINSMSTDIVKLREKINYVSTNKDNSDCSLMINKMEDELFELENKKSRAVSQLNSVIRSYSSNSILN